MSKLSKEQKVMIRNVANNLPTYNESFINRKHIHEKDIASRGLETKDYDKNKQYQINQNKGKRLIDADVHYKRLCNAMKKGEEEYRAYLIRFSKMSFRNLTIMEKVNNYIFGG